ncbi:MAG: hypothetical protein PF444_09710, partial [Bacteroidales bacterium]|nr:hypothetical protein [Bacteroidales bacterium]
MKHFTKKAFVFLLFAILGLSTGFAQVGAGTISPQDITEETSTITLKTIRALFPDQPVAVANELFGGLHSVASIEILHGSADLDTAELQIGMLVYVAETNMYYRYKGADADGLNHSAQTGSAVPDVLDVDGVNTNYWESLADIIADATANTVYNRATKDTSTATDPFVEGDVYLAGDTTFVWGGDAWDVMALNEIDSVSGDRATILTPVSGDVAVEADTTWIYDGAQWLS